MELIDEDREDFKAEALLAVRGLILSCREIDDQRKVELLEVIDELNGVSHDREAMRFALQIGKEEGVW